MGTSGTRIFLVHAEEDARFYNLLVNQARSARMTVEFTHMPTKQPWVPHWKAACRARVFQCDGAIAFITKRTYETSGIKTELDYVVEAGIPVLGVRQDQFTGSVPDQVRHAPLIEWNWAGIASFIQSLQRGTAGGAV